MLDHSNDRSKNGGHHFNSIVVNGERLVVMDGRVKDNFVNNRTRKLFNLIHGKN